MNASMAIVCAWIAAVYCEHKWKVELNRDKNIYNVEIEPNYLDYLELSGNSNSKMLSGLANLVNVCKQAKQAQMNREIKEITNDKQLMNAQKAERIEQYTDDRPFALIIPNEELETLDFEEIGKGSETEKSEAMKLMDNLVEIIKAVDIRNIKLTSKMIDSLLKYKNLERIHLSGNNGGPDELLLENLNKLEKLKHLEVDHIEDIRVLSNIGTLEKLLVDHAKLFPDFDADVFFSKMKNLRCLELLHVYYYEEKSKSGALQTSLMPDNAADLLPRLENIRVVDCAGTNKLQDIIKNLPMLTKADIDNAARRT